MRSGFDKETGEVLKDAWDAEAEMEGIRKVLNYRQCYVTRMPYEDTGLFWKATIYSPRDPKMGSKLSLPVKKGLDAKQYGGFSSQQFAYFFIYEAKKKGKPCFRFAEVPVWLAGIVGQHSDALAEYAKDLAEAGGLEFVSITRSRILKRQLIEIDGDRFVITGKKEMRNATELAFSNEELATLVNGGDENALNRILHRLIDSGCVVSARLRNQIKVDTLVEGAARIDRDSRLQIVLNVLSLVNGSTNMSDLSLAGGSKFSGCLQPNYSKILSDVNSDFFIIDQSVTGMFERKTRVGL